MPKGGGKGKISNDLVAASCAAVLTVYAAGYWRTRDAARQFETQVRGRRPAAQMRRAAASVPKPVLIEPIALAPQPRPKVAATIASARPETIPAPPSTTTAPVVAAATGPSSPPAAPEPAPASAAAEAGIAADPLTPTLASPTAPEPPSAPAAKWRDGTFTGRGESPHGGIDVRVVIKDGRIVEAGILGCYTRYPCEEIASLLAQPVERQSPDVDYVSHATESSDAYHYGLVDALNTALYQPPGKATDSQ
jgi:uncharacterized protein with FMN-binding domain